MAASDMPADCDLLAYYPVDCPGPPPAKIVEGGRPEDGGPEDGGPEDGGPDDGGPQPKAQLDPTGPSPARRKQVGSGRGGAKRNRESTKDRKKPSDAPLKHGDAESRGAPASEKVFFQGVRGGHSSTAWRDAKKKRDAKQKRNSESAAPLKHSEAQHRGARVRGRGGGSGTHRAAPRERTVLASRSAPAESGSEQSPNLSFDTSDPDRQSTIDARRARRASRLTEAKQEEEQDLSAGESEDSTGEQPSSGEARARRGKRVALSTRAPAVCLH